MARRVSRRFRRRGYITRKNKKLHSANLGARALQANLHAARSTNLGGAAVAAGTYGCVFKNPALKCSTGSNTKRSLSTSVSKLMLEKHMLKEMAAIDNVRQHIKVIPHNDRYFLVANTYACSSPKPLSTADRSNFDTVCKRLVKIGLNKDNINKHLDSVALIQMPDGGQDLDDILENIMEMSAGQKRTSAFTALNTKLVDLLMNAVLPLNKNGLLHNDIKGNNILVDHGNAGYPRLIDWGLACTFGKNVKEVPSILCDHSLNFNRPLAAVLFRKTEKVMLAKLDLAEALKTAHQLLKTILSEKVGHYYDLKERILPTLYPDISNVDHIIEKHVATVLLKFAKKNTKNSYTFDDVKYFQQVYKHNADIIGFLTCFKHLLFSNNKLDNFVTALRNIYVTYFFNETYAIEPIPIELLVRDLLALNALV